MHSQQVATVFVLVLASSALSGERDLADLRLPSNRLPEWNPGVEGGIPEVVVRSRVTGPAISDGAGRDDSKVIQQAIDTVPTPGAVFLAEGSYLLKTPLVLRSGVVLRGAGVDRTHLRFEIEKTGSTAITIAGVGTPIQIGADPDDVPVASGCGAGSKVLTTDTPSELRPGQYMALVSDNDLEFHARNGPWMEGGYAKYHVVGQVLRVTRVAGTEVAVDRPVRLGYFEEQGNPCLRPLDTIRHAGVEDLHISADAKIGGLFIVSVAADCWIRRCHTEYAMYSHVSVSMSRGITIRDNLMHHAHGYGGGGRGYGVWLGHWATDCLVENNVFHHLRHAMLTSIGANGNVFGYNTSSVCKHNCDISMHGFYSYMNLFEGNTVVNVVYSDYWGPVGPLNTCFRNRITGGGIHVLNNTHLANVVGNTFLKNGCSVQTSCEAAHVEKNLYSAKEHLGGDDGLVPTSGRPSWRLPASLYLRERPPFWGERPWPGIGADVDAAAMSEGRPLPATPTEARLQQYLSEAEE